ncbi:hypothetical protein HPB52_003164 [Rhipicephalus sanguineus]|uniref:Uncharacterized protein n=1 Tax=Rhipicephalus sanguineus TaxID=34632 RepID=A0A9D4T6T7_RHISA|nr:hypothetical protein HPB52_003164 [Rhipicephalus sanguineus]
MKVSTCSSKPSIFSEVDDTSPLPFRTFSLLTFKIGVVGAWHSRRTLAQRRTRANSERQRDEIVVIRQSSLSLTVTVLICSAVTVRTISSESCSDENSFVVICAAFRRYAGSQNEDIFECGAHHANMSEVLTRMLTVARLDEDAGRRLEEVAGEAAGFDTVTVGSLFLLDMAACHTPPTGYLWEQ